MHLDAKFKVKEVRNDQIRVREWPRERRYCKVYDVDADEHDIEEGDIVHLRIENHSRENGWLMDSLYGFHYDDEKKECEVCRT